MTLKIKKNASEITANLDLVFTSKLVTLIGIPQAFVFRNALFLVFSTPKPTLRTTSTRP
jgi:hypothetical protein